MNAYLLIRKRKAIKKIQIALFISFNPVLSWLIKQSIQNRHSTAKARQLSISSPNNTQKTQPFFIHPGTSAFFTAYHIH